MHFHLPKPMHGWREFVGEVGIIVVGVLIALGAEQVVEHFHDRVALHDAEDAMVSELRDDNLPQAYTRAAAFNCYADQLDAIKAAVASGDRSKVLELAGAYHPIIRTWDDEAWKSAIASQVLVQSGPKNMIGWSTAYVMVPRLANTALQEQTELPQIEAGLSGGPTLSAEQMDRLFQVLSYLDTYNHRMAAGSLTLLRFAQEQGLTLTQTQKSALLAAVRKEYGQCVHEPSFERLDLQTQITLVSDSIVGRRKTQHSPAGQSRE